MVCTQQEVEELRKEKESLELWHESIRGAEESLL